MAQQRDQSGQIPSAQDAREGVTRRAWRWGIAALCLGAALAAAVGWWAYFSRPVWTDGNGLRVSSSQAAPRTIVWTAPELLASSFNAEGHNYEPATSPDGGEIFFVRGKPGRNADIYVSERQGDAWTAPRPIEAINTDADELGPRLTPDGRFLVFYSDRKGGVGGYDLWASARDEGGWAKPFNLGPTVNSEYNEFCPSPAPDGRHLFFSTNRKSAARDQKEAWQATIRQSDVGDYDIFVAELDPAFALEPQGPALPYQWSAPTTRPAQTQPTTRAVRPATLVFQPAAEMPLVNSLYHDGAGAVSPLGDFFYFSSNRPGGYGKFDLYRCRLRDGQPFGGPENLGPQINTPENDTDPQALRDGFALMFSSDRAGKYQLLASESREVYAQRLGRDLPRFGWSAWVLLGALVLLVPLLLMLRGWSDRQLSLIQRCLLVSILFHVLLTIALSFMVVTGEVIKYARNEMGGGGMSEISVNLGTSRGTDISLAIRQVSSGNDVPAGPMPTPAAPQQAATSFEAALPVSVTLDTPQATSDRATASMLLPVSSKGPAVPAPAAGAAVVSAAVPASAGPALSFAESQKVSQPEGSFQSYSGPMSAASPLARSAMGSGTSAAPLQVSLQVQSLSPTEAGAASGGGIAASAVEIRLPVPGASGDVIRATTQPSLAAAPDVLPVGIPHGAAPVHAAESAIGPAQLASAGAPNPPQQQASAVASGAAPSDAVSSLAPPKANSAAELSADPGGSQSAAAQVRPSLAGAGPVASAAELTGLPQRLNGLAATTPGSNQKIDVPTSAPSVEAAVARAAGQLEQAALANGPSQLAMPGSTAGSVDIGALEIPVARTTADAGASSIAGPASAVRPTANASAGGVVPLAAATDVPAGELTAGAQLAGAKISATPQPGRDSLSAEPAAPVPQRAQIASAGSTAGGQTDLSLAAPLTISAPDRGPGLVGAGARVRGVEDAIVHLPIGPDIGITQPKISAPQALFQRAPEERQPLVEKMGGTKESETAVSRGLAYLARQQEPDGRWTRVHDESGPGRRERGEHDPAATGLSVLAFLASDHTPARDGPYRKVVSRGLDWLLAVQESNGDLRGPQRGGGADAGNMYDQGIATLALAEAALMTGDDRYKQAAELGARFIVAAQDRRGGGWRYVPGEAGDTSVFGWQIMALHSVEQLGVPIPDKTRDGITRYIRSAGTGRDDMLAGYQPGHGPSEPMTAELLFARILLGEQFTPQQTQKASRFMVRGMSEGGEYNLYYWYYSSLCLMQLQNDQWKEWNQRTREVLIALQRKDGRAAGSWDPSDRWGGQGGRIYSTALATLTLEVYYRYLPQREQPATEPAR